MAVVNYGLATARTTPVRMMALATICKTSGCS